MGSLSSELSKGHVAQAKGMTQSQLDSVIKGGPKKYGGKRGMMGNGLYPAAKAENLSRNYDDTGMVDENGLKIYKKKSSLLSQQPINSSELSRATGRSSTSLGG